MSCFSLIKYRTTINLELYKVNELKKYTKEAILERLFQYDDNLQGIPIYINNVEPLDYPKHYADQPAIHVKVQADFLLFSPNIGGLIPVKVNNVTGNSVNVEFLGTFTGSIDMTTLKKNWTYSEKQWMKGQYSFTEGSTIEVQILEYSPSYSSGITFIGEVIRPLLSSDE